MSSESYGVVGAGDGKCKGANRFAPFENRMKAQDAFGYQYSFGGSCWLRRRL